MSDLSLAKIDAVRLAIEEAVTVQEIKQTLDAANAVQVYAQQAKVGKDIELRAAEYVLRAERKLGELLQAAKAAGQITKANASSFGRHVGGDDIPVKLEDCGISRDLSSRAQRIASVPSAEFEQAISDAKQAGKLSKSLFSRNGKARAQQNKPPRKVSPKDRATMASELDQETKNGITDKETNKRLTRAWTNVTKDQNERACRYLARKMVLRLFEMYHGLAGEVADLRGE